MYLFGVHLSVRLSVCLSVHPSAARRCGGFAAVRSVGRRYRQIKAKFHYTDPTRTGHGQSPRTLSVRAKFHYTDPTGPARTQRSFAAEKGRAGPCGSGRVRVVEFSYYCARARPAVSSSRAAAAACGCRLRAVPRCQLT